MIDLTCDVLLFGLQPMSFDCLFDLFPKSLNTLFVEYSFDTSGDMNSDCKRYVTPSPSDVKEPLIFFLS